MHNKVAKDDFTLRSFLDLRTFETFQSSYSSPILNHAFDFWLAEIILNFLGKVVQPKPDQPNQFHRPWFIQDWDKHHCTQDELANQLLYSSISKYKYVLAEIPKIGQFVSVKP